MKNFFKKNLTIIEFIFATFFILLANINYFTWPFAVIVIVFLFSRASFSKQISYVCYFMMFSNICPIFVCMLLFLVLSISIRYVKEIKEGKKPFYRLEFYLILAFVTIYSLIHYVVDLNGFYNWALCVLLMIFMYYLFIYGKEINVKEGFKFLFIGLISSLLISLVSLFSVNALNLIYPFDGVYNRLKLFTLTVNDLAIYCIFGISYYSYYVFDKIIKNNSFEFIKNKEFWFRILQIILFLVVGLLTKSKAFILLCAIVAIYIIIMLICRLKLKSLLVLGILGIFFVITGLLFNDFIYKIISRFFIYRPEENIFINIFTGRTIIWQDYINDIFSSVWKILFGVGFLTQDIFIGGPHSVFLFLLYRVGIVGIIFLVCIIAMLIKRTNVKIKLTFLNFILLLIFLMLSFEEMMLNNRFFLLLVFALILVAKNKFDKNKKIDEI